MAQVTLRNAAGGDAGTVDLDDAMFGVQPNVPLMHQVVTAQLASRRAGTQSTKTRSEVRGGGAKPYRQKGTGNARQGSIRAPHYTGGGVALGPKPRSYAQRTPKKMIRLALRSALSDRASDGKVIVVDEWRFESPRTRDARAALDALGLDGRVLLVVDGDDAATALSFRNLPEIQLIQPGELNAYDVLCNDWIVFTRATLPTAPTDRAQDDLAEAGERRSEAIVADTDDDATQAGERRSEAEPASSEASAASPESAEPASTEASDDSTGAGERRSEAEPASTEASAASPEEESEPS